LFKKSLIVNIFSFMILYTLMDRCVPSPYIAISTQCGKVMANESTWNRWLGF